MVTRRSTLPALLMLSVVLATADPGAAQTIEQRFERWFGPPVGQSGQGAAPRRPAAETRPRAVAPAAANVPTPSERPDEPSQATAATEAPLERPGAASGIAAEPDAASEAGMDVARDDGPEAPDDPADDAGAAETGASASAPAALEPGAPATPEMVPVPDPRPSAEKPPEPEAADEPEPDAEPDAGVPADAEDTAEPEPSPAYVPPENARTSPEESAPETPDFEVTPEESVDAARAVEDARECEAELEARGAEFSVAPSLSDGQCGVLRPVSLTRTSSGVEIGPGTQMLCRTALAFDIWVGESVAPAARAELGMDAPTAIRQVSTYVCRDRASESGISEHGRGSAIDVGAFEWESREPIVVEEQAPGSPEDRFLANIRRAACGPFQTVIGPGTDADHSDHFHFDIAARSNGSTYCR